MVVERLGNGLHGLRREIGRGIERGGRLLARLELGHLVVLTGITSRLGMRRMGCGPRRAGHAITMRRAEPLVPRDATMRIRIRHIMEYYCGQ